MVEAPNTNAIPTPISKAFHQLPVLALIGIFDKHNEPVILQNYLARHLQNDADQKVAFAEQALQGSEDDIERIKRAARQEMEAIEM